MLRVVAKEIGKDWKDLGTFLGITAAQVDKYQSDYPSDLNEQVFRMLLYWWCRHDPEAAEDGLKEALKEIGRTDILKLLGMPYFKNLKSISFPFGLKTCLNENFKSLILLNFI